MSVVGDGWERVGAGVDEGGGRILNRKSRDKY